MEVNKEVVEKYIPETISLYGPACIIASSKIMKAKLDYANKAYERMNKDFDEYKKQCIYNRKWYVRFCRFIRNIFNR